MKVSATLRSYSCNPTHTTCHSETAGCQGGEIWKPGWDAGISKHPKTPVSSAGGPGSLEGSCTAVPHSRRETVGPERVVCAGWGQVPGAPFQLHEPKLTAPYSSSSPAPGHSLQAVSSSPGDAGFAWGRQEGTPVWRNWGWGALQATLLRLCAEAQGAFLSRHPHLHWHSVPKEASTVKWCLTWVRGAGFAAH